MESIDEQTGVVNIEVKDSNHPDIWSVEGIARALRGLLGLSPPQPLRVSGKSSLRVIVDKKLLHVRPFIGCAIVRGVHPSEEALKSWINLQDKMDQTYGRKRRKASIGLYQSDRISSPLHYTVRDPESVSFVPLGSSEEMTLQRILEAHPKGQEYGSIISSFEQWPLLVDGKGQTLSLPPIINSNDLGRITTSTRNILVEVTGTNLETVHNTLKIVVSSLAERGGRVFTCVQTYIYKPGRTTTPDLNARPARVSLEYLNRILGTSLSLEHAQSYLRIAGYGAKSAKRGEIAVEVPPYRLDIMHPVDLIEDVAIAMDLNSLKPEWPKVWTPGGLTKETEEEDTVAEVMVGLGYQEVLTYVLTSPDRFFLSSSQEPSRSMKPGLVEWVPLANPKMETHTALRGWLLPSLLEFLSKNRHVDYPQRIFEIGPCAKPVAGSEGVVENLQKLVAITSHASAGFSEIRATLDALLNNLGVKHRVEGAVHQSFLDGRCGEILVEDKLVGIVGEVHPRVILAWRLDLPVAALELDVAELFPTPNGQMTELS